MTVHLESGVATSCVSSCDHFIDALRDSSEVGRYKWQASTPGAFDTARQIGTVYSLFAGEDLRTLLNGYVDQAKAMSMLFAAAGGLIEAQDEAVAAALGNAAQEPAGLQSLGLLGSLGSMSVMLDAADQQSAPGGYDRVGPEEVSGAPLARMVSGAQALEPGQFAQVSERVSAVAADLQTAAADLRQGLGDALGSQWQGEFATQASASVGSFTSSVTGLATVLEQVAEKAGIAENGFSTTRSRITDESVSFQAAQLNTPGFGAFYGPPTRESATTIAAAEAAAEEQARAVVNTVYSPAVMDANLADLDIPSPYRVVSPAALGGAGGVDLVSAWNVDGVMRRAGAAVPSADAIAAAGGGGSAGSGAVGGNAPAGPGAASGGAGPGATTTLPTTAHDAATEHAFLASRGAAADGGGAGAAPAGAGGANAGGTNVGGLNAATTSAGAPFVPGTAANGRSAGAGGAAGMRGIRGGNSDRQRSRGFGSAAGVLGGGGAAGTGAGAARMGGAGTLAGVGTPGGPVLGGPGVGGPGLSGPGVGGPGSGSLPGGSGSAGGPAGALSSSSTGGAQAGRAGMMPMGMMGAAGTGQQGGRRGHTPAGYLTSATNASAIVGDPVRVAPAVVGRTTPAQEVAGISGAESPGGAQPRNPSSAAKRSTSS